MNRDVCFVGDDKSKLATTFRVSIIQRFFKCRNIGRLVVVNLKDANIGRITKSNSSEATLLQESIAKFARKIGLICYF